jgi:nucleotide-binding universal stress UspA family protein
VTINTKGHISARSKEKMMKILLAIDGSGHSDAAVHELTRQHFPAASEVRIISVVVPLAYSGGLEYAGGGTAIYAEIEDAARVRARAAVDKAATQLQAEAGSRPLNVTTKILSGLAKGAILDEAEAFGAELIVVGSHGHGKLERFLLGSVAHAVALHAKCSVEIVRSPKAQTHKST